MPWSHLIFIPAVFLIGVLVGVLVTTHRAGRPTALVAALGVFVITLFATHLAPVPGGVRALRASVSQQQLFDQHPTFSPDAVYRRISDFGATGREAYQQFTYTTDLIFPLALFLFLFMLARFVDTRVAPVDIPQRILKLAPRLWLTSDLVENGIIYFLLATYPTRHAIPAALLAFVTVSKFVLLLVSFALPLALYMVSLRKSTPTVAVA